MPVSKEDSICSFFHCAFAWECRQKQVKLVVGKGGGRASDVEGVRMQVCTGL